MSSSGNGRPWRYAHASVIGRSHLASGTVCQDASVCEILSQAGASTLFAVVSDGAGSAPCSQIGARYACALVLDEARAALGSGGGVGALDREFALGALERFQHALARLARRAGRPVRDFACTLLMAAVDEGRAAFAQIGDGAIVVSPSEPEHAPRYEWVFWPQQGEYVNQTNFASEPAAREKLQFEARAQDLAELALFSDGLQGLVLDARARVAHGRFFEPMFQALRGVPAGRSAPHCVALERFLASRGVDARTDDDKSLVLASRRAPQVAAALPASARLLPQELRP